ncbi:relaxase/mobilization nuclease domain-containing protein [Streptomyces sp. H39-C1]|uniref:relaxase/mobilization nuclease domain-containing protein n=1 Tax=Streptomyces sp. H39-C1 TaxID=3004355 RepID=UPI0022AFF0EB|nr:mobilization protein [Streptomyces sp. H39-C1]MCZ4103046.1 mobilization protein [Streptomyces sp. H39-C1]
MIASISRGDRTRGVLAYVYGPGDVDEHTHQHTVAGFEELLPDPGRATDPEQALDQLAKILDLRVVQAGKRAPKEHVWHCSLRAAPEDRHLSDPEWEQVARRVMEASGIAPAGDPDGCRWVVVRHAEDHVHIVATTVRADLTHARLHRDWHRVMTELSSIETDFGLRQVDRTPSGHRTSPRRATRAELHKAKRLGKPEPSRQTLRSAVRESLAGAVTEEEILARLADHGVRVKIHRLPSGDARGYSFALPGERKANGEPLWFPGTQLGPDLTLPKIRARLHTGATTVAVTGAADAHRKADRSAEQALHVITSLPVQEIDEPTATAISAGLGEILDVLPQVHLGATRAQLRQAARAYGQAAYVHDRAADQQLRALRCAARTLLDGGPALGRGKDADGTAMVLSTMVLLVIAAYRWHEAHGHRQQANAARAAADHLRATYLTVSVKPLANLTLHGEQLPPAVRNQHAQAVHQALPPELAARVLAEPGWNALAATLAQAAAQGQPPVDVLRDAFNAREIATADSASSVLTWRIRRNANLPTASAVVPPTQRKPARTSAPQTPRPATAPMPPAHRPRR